MALFGKLVPATGALLLVAGTLGAQAPACDVDAGKGNLAKATFTLQKAGTSPSAADLTTAVKQLEAAKGEDATARSLLMGQTLAFWLSQPNMPPVPKRAALGFAESPEATIDLVATVDSLFKVVEAAKPGCTQMTTAYRGGLPGYLALVNGAIGAMNADKLDSAEYYASAADRLYGGSPYGTMVLGSIAAKRGNQAKAAEYWAASAKVAATDTIYIDVQRQVLNSRGSALLDMALTANGAEKVTAGRGAAAAFTELLAVPGTSGLYAATGRKSLQQAYLLLGDTAAFVASYQPLLANPAAYGHQDLLNTAVNAALANRAADAAKLFEASLVQNPYSRDALFNLAVVYHTLEQYNKVPGTVSRLVAVDPSNPENFTLGAQAYLALGKSAKAAKRAAQEKAFNDTTITWYNRGNLLPAEVRVTEFITGEKELTIAGTVLDRRDKVEEVAATAAPARGARARAAAKPSAAPTAVTLKIEALDKSGAVLGTKTVTTEPLTPGKTARFSTRIDAPGAVAYRYTVGG